MRRPVVIGASPYIFDYYRKSARQLFDETGGNTGNLAFEYAVVSHLAGTIQVLPLGAPVQQIRAAGDILILPLANQLGKHTDLGAAAERLDNINLPVLGIGLGAQAISDDANIELTEGTDRWLRTLARLAPSGQPNLAVRGIYTKEQIARYGLSAAAVVTGCPSHFINTKDDIAERVAKGFERTPRLVAVAAGIPYIPKLARLERDLANIVTATGGAYIVQHGIEMLRLARNEFHVMSPETLEICRKYIAPDKSMEDFKLWCRRYAYAFYDVRSWMDFLTRFDFVIGTRFHGAMLAIQAGIPAACIAHDSRTREMCETMGIPVRNYTEISHLTADSLLDYFKFDRDKFKETRELLHSRYISVYRDAEVQLKPSLVNMFS